MKGKNKLLKVIVLLLFVLWPPITNIVSQQIDLEKKISIVSRDKPLGEILKEIEQKGKLNFSYSNQQIIANQKLSIIARHKTISVILSQLFNKAGIEYMEVEKQIILKPKREKEKEEPKIEIGKEIKKYTLNGYLKDSETGEALIGATIAIKNSLTGTLTNSYGFFSITLPSGFYELNFSYLGYLSVEIPINLNKNVQLIQNLLLDEKNLEVIVISAKENKDIHELNPLKKIEFSSIMMSSKVGINGETDLIQILQSIPGIQSQSDGSVFFFTRGGNKDQNLILVDDAPIYNPSHLFGFFSTISPDDINNINIYKNYFPIQYGGKLSSIIDIRTKDGNMNNFGFSGNFTPLTKSLSFEGPIIKEKVSYHLSIRNSNVNWLSNKILNNQSTDFVDIHAKLNAKINPKNRLYFSFYSGNDFIRYFETGYSNFAIKWQNFATTLRWNHLFSDRLFSNTMIYTSLYDYYLYTSLEKNQYWNSLIGNLSFKSDFTFYANTKNTFRFGIVLNNYFFNPGNLNADYFTRKVSASSANETILYFGNETRPFENLSINYGIRLISWNNIGPSVNYTFNENYNPIDTANYAGGVFNSYFNFEPRLDLMYSINKSNSIKLSYNHQIQNLHLLSNSISPFTTLEIWMPSDPNIKPQKMDQFVVAYYKKNAEFDFSIEGYFKKMLNQIEYAEHANMLLNPLIESQLRFGKSNSYGIEFNMKKQTGNLTGLISYSYSRIVNNIKDINANRKYAPFYDKPHQFNISLSYKASERWRLNANWTYCSGNRFSAPSGFYYYHGYSIPFYTEKNNAKLPDYHRLDVSASYRLNKNENAKYTHHLTFTIINLYGRKNPISVNFNKFETPDGNYAVPSNYISENQLIPTSIYLLGIAPSISYKFSFKNKK